MSVNVQGDVCLTVIVVVDSFGTVSFTHWVKTVG